MCSDVLDGAGAAKKTSISAGLVAVFFFPLVSVTDSATGLDYRGFARGRPSRYEASDINEGNWS
jgi:hypothetical protein